MNDSIEELIGSDLDDGLELSQEEESRFMETFDIRMSNPVTVSITSADDGFDVVFESQTIASDRGTASGHNINIDLFELAKRNYINSRSAMNGSAAKIWRRIIKKIGAGRALDVEVRCWNAGGPSQVTFTVSAEGVNSVGGRKDSTHNPGITFVGKYEIRFDRLIGKNLIVVVSEDFD